MALLIVLVVVVGVGIALHRAARNRAFHRAAVRTEAEITEIRWKDVGPLPERDRLAYPMLRFTLPDGSVYEARSERHSSGDVGDRVEVLYLPQEPGRVRVAT